MTAGDQLVRTESTPDGRLILGGVRTDGARTFTVLDPYRSEAVAEVHSATSADVDLAVELARKGARQVASLPVHARVDILRGAAQIVQTRADEIARTISRQTGKAVRDAEREVTRSTYTLRAAAAAAESLAGEIEPADAIPGGEGLIAMVLREPLGVVAAIAPFNAPFNLAMHKAAAAFAAGNAVIVKPSSYAPISAYHLAEVLIGAGMPEAGISVLPGSSVGPALVSHPGVDAVSFTGGVAAGTAISANAGLKPVVLELGGNSPNVVHEDADLDWAVRALVAGGFSNTGQSCNSVQRIYVHASVIDDMLELLTRAVNAMTVGDPLDPATDVGTLVDEANAIRVEGLVADAVAAGARAVTGGKRDGAAYWPTVLADVTSRMRVCADEVFGPVVIVSKYETLDEVIREANSTPFGLQAGVFTRSLSVAFTLARGIDAGGVMINRSSNTRLDHLPFGGINASGRGREGGRFSLEEMTRRKLVLIDATATGQPHPLAR